LINWAKVRHFESWQRLRSSRDESKSRYGYSILAACHRATKGKLVVRVASHALAVESDLHLAERWVTVHILLLTDTVAPLPTPDTANAVACSAAVAVVSDVVGEYVVSGVGKMLVWITKSISTPS